MQENKNKVEAILFTTGRFLSFEEISKLSGIGSLGYLKETLNQLKQDYNGRESALEILEENGKWKLNIRKEFLYLTEKLLSNAELELPIQETLAVIAYKQPAIQSDVIKVRGNKAYDHISLLKELNFVISERFGRTRLLKLTPKFYDYFDVVKDSDSLKEVLKKAEEKVSGNESKEN